jgi:4-hydroxy-tetrahydrodipicolinate reductase
MGRRLVGLGAEDPGLQIVAAIEHPAHGQLGEDAGVVAGLASIGVPLTVDLPQSAQVLIDFSVPEGAARAVSLCRHHHMPLVMATTGLAESLQTELHQLATEVPVVWAPSMSLAVNLAMKLVSTAAQHLRDYAPGADAEIIERHHRFKEDAPSGTALRFGEIIADKMGQKRHVHGRQGRPGMRAHEEIGYHALRTGDNPGEHTIVFGMMGETLELTVKATNRDCYALGAIAAAKYVACQKPGLYTMTDVFGL